MTGKNKTDVEYIDTIALEMLEEPAWKSIILSVTSDIGYNMKENEL